MDKKNILIVFCGMDGTGKTALAKKLTKYFNRQGLRYECIHGHSYNISRNSFGLDERKVNNLRLLLKLLIPFAFADNLFTFYFKYKPILMKRILICDRYFYDKLARMIYFRICSKYIAKMYLILLPKPDFTFFLDVSSTDAYIRKKQYSKGKLLRYRIIYRFLAVHLKASVIDTSRSIDTCFKEILKLLQK